LESFSSGSTAEQLRKLSKEGESGRKKINEYNAPVHRGQLRRSAFMYLN